MTTTLEERPALPGLARGLLQQRATLVETVRAVVKSRGGRDPSSFDPRSVPPVVLGPLWPDPVHVRQFLEVTSAHVADFEGEAGLALPPTYAATWGMRLMSRLLGEARLDLPLSRVLHVGNRVRFERLPRCGEELHVSARLSELDVTPTRSIVSGELEHRDADGALLFTVTMTMFFPGRGKPDRSTKKKPPERVPYGAHCLSRLRPQIDQIRRYTAVSGDFNPVHVSHLAAKAAGFPRAFIHGYATKAIAAHAVIHELCGGDPDGLVELDVSFRRPMFTGLDCGIYLGAPRATDLGSERALSIGPGPGERACVTGRVVIRERSEA